MKDSEYLEQLFIEFIPTLEAINEASESFHSKDESKLRHRIFKLIYNKYKSHKIKLALANFKAKIFNFKLNYKERQKNNIIKKYNKLKENGEFLPTIKD